MDESFTTSDSVLAYLGQASTGIFKAKSCARLTGGFSNFVWRVNLVQPYCEYRTVILKHAKSYASAITTISLDVERMRAEREALIAFQPITEKDHIHDSVIRLPKVFHWDPEKNVLIMEDAGDLPSLKTFLSQESSIPSPERAQVAGKIGQNLGSFLALLHTVGQSPDGQEYRDVFAKKIVARELCAWRTAGRLKETAIQYGVNDSRIDEIVAYIIKETHESEETFNIGDFWTGNVLVSASPTGCLNVLWILDWELAKYGPASTDLGQFCAESWTSAHFRDHDAGLRLLQSFKAAYLAAASPTLRPSSGFGGAEVALHLAAHVIVWTPRVGWSDDEEKIKKTLGAMFDHVLTAWDALKNNKDLDWWIAP